MTNAANQVLIVDDEPSLLKMMSVYLERLGYGVVTAGSTEKAWAAVEAAPHAFALALLDATMSGVRMEDLAARILAADPRVCVIACSGYPVDIAMLQAAAPGRVMFLHKPFTPEMLGSTVRRMIATQEKDV
jgi:two-component system cell cycle sensor histidine kinase/response regulator CckA